MMKNVKFFRCRHSLTEASLCGPDAATFSRFLQGNDKVMIMKNPAILFFVGVCLILAVLSHNESRKTTPETILSHAVSDRMNSDAETIRMQHHTLADELQHVGFWFRVMCAVTVVVLIMWGFSAFVLMAYAGQQSRKLAEAETVIKILSNDNKKLFLRLSGNQASIGNEGKNVK
jgi:hypothetical protein